jgi:hypothetical protein
MKFSMAIEKKTKVTVGKTEGHNTRLHATRSQLPEPAWVTKKGRHEVMPWRQEVLDAGTSLAKRKDAVVAIELIIQVGNQTDWRLMPTPEHPHGKPKPGAAEKLKALMAGAKQAAIREFGEKNIVGIDLHTDESTPHIHIVVTPVKDGKLQAKAWLDGAKKCALLRSRIHDVVTGHIHCTYDKGASGGDPHDPQKAAGGPRGPQPPEGPPNLLKRALGAFDAVAEVKALKSQLGDLQAQLQTMFSRVKRVEREADRDKEKRQQTELRASAAERSESKLKKRVLELEHQLEQLQPKPMPKEEPTAAPSPNAGRPLLA